MDEQKNAKFRFLLCMSNIFFIVPMSLASSYVYDQFIWHPDFPSEHPLVLILGESQYPFCYPIFQSSIISFCEFAIFTLNALHCKSSFAKYGPINA